jgi:LysR family transcriptional regulator, transcriptional activator for dmlA
MGKAPDLNDVTAFVAAAKAGTLSGAARDMGLPTSTVSRALTRLEEHVGVLLIRRNQRGLVLTDAGKEYLTSCRRALRSLRDGSELIERQRVNPSGLLRVVAPVCFAKNTLAPLLAGFLKTFPEMKVELDLYSSGWDQEGADEVDVYFKVRTPKDSAQRCHLYPKISQGLFASQDYLSVHGAPRDPTDLSKHRCIGLLAETNFNLWKLMKGTKTTSPELHFVLTASDPEIHCQLALDGVGVAVLPLWLAKQPHVEKHLVPVLPSWQPIPIALCALYSGASRLTPKIEVFMDYLKPFIGTERDPCLRGAPAKVCFIKP